MLGLPSPACVFWPSTFTARSIILCGARVIRFLNHLLDIKKNHQSKINWSMQTIFKAFSLLILFFALLSSKCELNPNNLVTIPASDPTPPSVILDVHFSQSGKAYISVTPYSGDLTSMITPNEEISLAAKGTDADGGCQDIQIWVETTTWKQNPDGSMTQTGSGLQGMPTASNPDLSAKSPGDQARKERLLTHKVDIAQLRGSADRIRIKVWAEAVNFHGGKSKTGVVSLEEN